MKKKDLDKNKIAQYQKSLFNLKEKITSDIRQISKNSSSSDRGESGDISGHVMHLADVATDMYDREFSLGLASNDRELLSKIDKALKRIEDGVFGICEECDGPIREIRLKALPYVENCLKCQEKLESQ
ncbi:MAG: TraR/DksA family transcriptional regulator [Candidatus Omnitrophica bacterium]|nr:TraR/DksA family transcriptional regulator [Candidatus Omnitrophota bacterium]